MKKLTGVVKFGFGLSLGVEKTKHKKINNFWEFENVKIYQIISVIPICRFPLLSDKLMTINGSDGER